MFNSRFAFERGFGAKREMWTIIPFSSVNLWVHVAYLSHSPEDKTVSIIELPRLGTIRHRRDKEDLYLHWGLWASTHGGRNEINNSYGGLGTGMGKPPPRWEKGLLTPSARITLLQSLQICHSDIRKTPAGSHTGVGLTHTWHKVQRSHRHLPGVVWIVDCLEEPLR